MKTKKLIELLQAADATGELECCVGNVDIHFVSQEPAYYDGRLEILIRDENIRYYNVIGAKITGRGRKIQIHTLSIEDAMIDDPDLPVDLSECSNGDYAAAVEKWRASAKQCDIDAANWAKEHIIPKE